MFPSTVLLCSGTFSAASSAAFPAILRSRLLRLVSFSAFASNPVNRTGRQTGNKRFVCRCRSCSGAARLSSSTTHPRRESKISHAVVLLQESHRTAHQPYRITHHWILATIPSANCYHFPPTPDDLHGSREAFPRSDCTTHIPNCRIRPTILPKETPRLPRLQHHGARNRSPSLKNVLRNSGQLMHPSPSLSKAQMAAPSSGGVNFIANAFFMCGGACFATDDGGVKRRRIGFQQARSE